MTGTPVPARSMPKSPVDPSLAFEICDALRIDQRVYALAAEPLAIYFALTDASSPFAGTLTSSVTAPSRLSSSPIVRRAAPLRARN